MLGFNMRVPPITFCPPNPLSFLFLFLSFVFCFFVSWRAYKFKPYINCTCVQAQRVVSRSYIYNLAVIP